MLWNDTLRYLKLNTVSSSITLSSALASKLCSSNFDLINPIANGPPYIGKLTFLSKNGNPPMWSS